MIERKRMPNRYLMRQDTPLMSRRRAWPYYKLPVSYHGNIPWFDDASYDKLVEVKEWCQGTMPNQFVEFHGEYWFANEEVATAFMLRWI